MFCYKVWVFMIQSSFLGIYSNTPYKRPLENIMGLINFFMIKCFKQPHVKFIKLLLPNCTQIFTFLHVAIKSGLMTFTIIISLHGQCFKEKAVMIITEGETKTRTVVFKLIMNKHTHYQQEKRRTGVGSGNLCVNDRTDCVQISCNHLGM